MGGAMSERPVSPLRPSTTIGMARKAELQQLLTMKRHGEEIVRLADQTISDRFPEYDLSERPWPTASGPVAEFLGTPLIKITTISACPDGMPGHGSGEEKNL